MNPARRRIYLMRHGSVDYFRADGTPLPPEQVPLNREGEQQADAAGALFRRSEVHFDQVVVSGLPRTVQTARRVLDALSLDLPIVHAPQLQEIRGGRLSAIAPEDLEAAFLGAFQPGPDVASRRFLGGESVGELLDRVLPAFAQWRQRDDWQSLLMVLHGGVNRALISTLMAGRPAFFGALEQHPACINVLDLGQDEEDVVVRALNLAPTQWLHAQERMTTMEKLLAQYQGR